jgi:membrane-bound ClpP family serine protease
MEWYLTIALILFGVGAVMLLAEFFFPTGGIFVVLGLVSFASAVGLILLYGDRREAVAAILSLSIGLPIAGILIFAAWKSMALKPALESETTSTTVAHTPEIAELELLRGKYGKTVSPMRPSGTVEIDGRRIDAMSEGTMLDANVWIQCVDVRTGRVIVRQSNQPTGLSDLDLDELK